MPRKPREPRRKRLALPAPRAPLVQVMPGCRARLDPTAIRELTAWVAAYCNRYVTVASKTLRGLKGQERALVLAKRRAAESAYETLFLFAACLTDTIDLRLIDAALRQWDSATGSAEPITLPYDNPSLPGTT